MCGRYTLHHSIAAIADYYDVDHVTVAPRPRYNIAPGQPATVIVQQAQRTVEAFRWGLIPFWARDARIGNRLINARAETVATKPAFRAAFRRRRCLLPASGFYEWRQTASGKVPTKVPIYVCPPDQRPLALAGLWEEWLSPEDEVVHTCTIITTAANELLAPIHPRMPVILEPPAAFSWLAADTSRENLQALLQPYPSPRLTAYPVSTRVNAPGYDAPDCIEPSPPPGE